MIWLKAYIGTLVAFLALDAVWLGVIAKGFYAQRIGSLMRDSPLWGAAALFYLIYLAGIVFLAVNPALASGSWKTAALYGAVLGFVAYGTYDMTNWATLEGWPADMVVIDLAWGTFLTATAATVGYLAAR